MHMLLISFDYWRRLLLVYTIIMGVEAPLLLFVASLRRRSWREQALVLASIALVAQVVTLWRRGRAGWWRRLPLAAPTLWAAICGFLAVQAWSFYRDVTAPFVCPLGEMCDFKGLCIVVGSLGMETQFALIVAIVALGLGWLALARSARRTHAAL